MHEPDGNDDNDSDDGAVTGTPRNVLIVEGTFSGNRLGPYAAPDEPDTEWMAGDTSCRGNTLTDCYAVPARVVR